MKLYVGILIVICTVEFIDASCLSYGHSCWGAHGKRSYTPQRESKSVELNDRWALFKMLPERNDIFQFNKLLRESPNQLSQYPENLLKAANFPSIQQLGSSDEVNQNDDKDGSRNIDTIMQSNEETQRHNLVMPERIPFNMKPFQVVRLNKPNYEQ